MITGVFYYNFDLNLSLIHILPEEETGGDQGTGGEAPRDAKGCEQSGGESIHRYR